MDGDSTLRRLYTDTDGNGTLGRLYIKGEGGGTLGRLHTDMDGDSTLQRGSVSEHCLRCVCMVTQAGWNIKSKTVIRAQVTEDPEHQA